MNRISIGFWTGAWLMAASAFPQPAATQGDAAAPVITLINGAAVEGTVTGVSAEGLEVQTERGKRTYPWVALSPGTRFRYDMTYRMNIDGFLAGEPGSSLTNAPDPDYDPLNPATSAPEATAEPASTTRTLDFTLIELAPPLVPTKIPALTVLDIGRHAFHPVQYGPGADQIALFGIAPDEGEMVMYDAGASRLAREKPVTRAYGGSTYRSFPGISLSASFGDIEARQTVQWLITDDQPPRRFLTADVELSRGSRRATFVLNGPAPGGKPGTETVTPVPLLVEPAPLFTVAIEDNKAYLVGKIRMGRLSLAPRTGMDLKIALKIANSTGSVVVDQGVPFAADIAPDDYPLRVDISTLETGRPYTLSAEIDLGTFLGPIRHEETFIMPDPMKY